MEKFQQEDQIDVRPVARVLARELTVEELNMVGGGSSMPNSNPWEGDKFDNTHDYVK